mmetsp:Transcript_91170/g.260370  ORF Transcript_91170/g.260370 Transcript_91170/m.260370 type:complete len:114 (-) Transcript_91170:159-500(-)
MDISNDELDDILDSALEEFEEEELNEISKSIGSTLGKGADDKRIDKSLSEDMRNDVTAQLHSMINDLDDKKNPQHAETLAATFKQLSGTAEGAETLDQVPPLTPLHPTATPPS